MSFHFVVIKVFASPKVHAAIDLAAVGADDLAIKFVGHTCGKASFATCSGAGYGEKVVHVAACVLPFRADYRSSSSSSSSSFG